MPMNEQEIDAEVAEIQKLADVEYKELMAEIRKRLGADVDGRAVSWANMLRLQAEDTILRRRLVERIDELERRLAEVEAGGLKYLGTYQRAIGYSRGSVVSHDGSAWIALQDLRQGLAPGESNSWQLAVKRGRDGKDAR